MAPTLRRHDEAAVMGRPDDPGPRKLPATPERRSLPRLQPTGSSTSPRKGEVRLAAPHHPTGR